MNRPIAANISAFTAGLIFAIGLGIAGMTLPQKIISFLDVTGNLDPSLIFVMGGALAVHLVTYRLVMRRKSPLFDASFHLPNRNDIDIKLIVGSALFGVGWGLAGYCPGPAVVALASMNSLTIAFFISMVFGITGASIIFKNK